MARLRALLFLLIVLPAVAGVAAPLSMQFARRAISASGVTPRGTVAIFGISYGLTSTTPPISWRSRHAQLLRDDDGDGTVTLAFDRDIPTAATWVIVDANTGQWIAQGSPGYTPGALVLQDFARNDNAGQLRKLAAKLPEIEVLIVRPDEGAWTLNAAKRSRIDEGGRGEPLQIDVKHAVPLGSTSSVHALRPGDIIAIINPLELTYLVTEVGR